MAINRIRINAPVDVVFEVLLDVPSYPLWVVGSKRIRAVDPTWPAPGSKFHHAVGWGPLEVRDSTILVEVQPPKRLVLEVRVRPLVGIARVVITLHEGDGFTDLEIDERPTRGPIRRLNRSVVDRTIAGRNWYSLRRLKAWCEQRYRGTPVP